MEGEESHKRNPGNAGRCTKANAKKKYSKKIRYHGKKKEISSSKLDEHASQQQIVDVVVQEDEEACCSSNVVPPAVPVPIIPLQTVSQSKIIDIDFDKVPDADDDAETLISGYRLMDMSILANVFASLSCPGCHDTKTLILRDIFEKKRGLARYLVLECSSCLYTTPFYTSKEVERKEGGKGRNLYEVNVRSVYGCRQIGSGHEHLKKLCCFLNMPEPMTSDNYDNISNLLKDSAKVVAEKSMSQAATDLRGADETADVGVSVDGTWQRKGFTSMNGVITAISVDSGKVLDVSILSKSCKGCIRMKAVEKSDRARYELWKASHKCSLNYTGSSPGMEKVGAENIFNRSVDKHGLYYISFYGDGDSKSFSSVEDVYGPTKKMTKCECVGHYQKRVGTRLRKLKKKTKGLGGKGRLTDTKIDTLQNYFGIALRQNVGNLAAMIKACKASMYHVADYHDNCPKTTDSWCQFQKDKLLNTSDYKSKVGLPVDIRTSIVHIYNDLCKPENLEKCLHGKTQNANESFNGMIWNRIPKANHVALNTLSLGVYDAIAHFNMGSKASLDILEDLNVIPGEFMSKSSQMLNVTRKRMSSYRMSETQKRRRKVIRHNRKKKQDNDIDVEGKTYEAGGF